MSYRLIGRTLLWFAVTGMLVAPGGAEAAIGPGDNSSTPEAAAINSAAATGPVRVSDAEGKPLAGVTLSTQPRPGVLLPENITETTVSQTNNSGTLMQPPREVAGVYFLLRKAGYETLALNAARPLPSKITLRPSRTITGGVFTPAGQPVAGAVVGPVSLSASPGSAQSEALLPRMAVRTGSDGSFTLDGLPPTAVDVQFWAPGYAPRLVTFAAGQNEQKIALSAGAGLIRGTVLGSKDRAPQAAIAVEAQNGQNMVVYGRTDDRGIYVIDNLPEGTWYVRPAGGGPLSGTQSRAIPVEIHSQGQELDVPLVLNQGVMLAGRAVDAETSRGLSGINITLAGYAGKGARAVLTEADGSFLFENLDSMQDVIIRFDPVKFVYLLPNGSYRDYFDINQVTDTNFDVTTLTIPLHRRQPLQGDVTDNSGKAVADVEVRMQALDVVADAPGKSGINLLTFSTKSNGEGKFTAGVYPPGQYKVWAQSDELVSQVETVDIFTTAPKPELKLRLDQPAQLEGMVTDAKDRPVTGAVVIAWPADAPEPQETPPIPGRESYAYARSDMEGRFTLSGLRGEPLAVRATHRDYFQPARIEVDPKAVLAGTTTSGVALQFPPGGEFTVYVTDDRGQALSQAEVAVEYREELDGHRASVTTDRYGRAFGSSIPAKQLERVTITHPMFASFKQEGPIPLPVNGITVSLQKRASLTARVNGENLYPGVTPEIFLLQAPLTSSDAVPSDNSFEQTNRAQVVAGQVIFPSLPEGWYKVAFADAGSYAESDTVKIEPGGGDQQVEIDLPKGNHLLGLVTDKTSGDPIAGANITLHPAVQSDIVAERATQNTTTQSDGSFELYNVGSGRVRVRVIAANYPDYDKTISFSPDEPMHIELTNEPAELSGRVLAGGQPVQGALLILSSDGENAMPVGTATTDEAGQYSMDGLSAGSYSLSVEAPIGEGENISRKSVAVELEGGAATKDVEFAALVTVTGRVQLNGKTPSSRTGEPIVLLFRGSAADMESKMVFMESNGTYSTQLEPGEYIVSLEDSGGVPVTVNAGSSQTVDLSF